MNLASQFGINPWAFFITTRQLWHRLLDSLEMGIPRRCQDTRKASSSHSRRHRER